MMVRVRWGALGAGVAAIGAMTGCFRGSFLDDTCEQLPQGCAAATSTGATSGTTAPPTTEPASSTSTSGASSTGEPTGTTGAAPGILFDGPAFRVDTLTIVDPHLFLSAFACQDVQDFINSSLTTSIAQHDTNLVLLAKNYDPAAPTQEFYFYRDAGCPIGEDYCLLLEEVVPTIFVSFNRDELNCYDVSVGTLNPENINDLSLPVAPCVISPTASLPLQITPDLDPVTFYVGQFAAQYSLGDADPTALISAILYGFIPRSDGEKINYTYNNFPINFWSVVRGSSHPMACPVPMGAVSDVDYFDEDGDGPLPPIEGVFLYMNFTARKIDFYAPPP